MSRAQYNLQNSGTNSATVTIPNGSNALGGHMIVIDYIYAYGTATGATQVFTVDVTSATGGIILVIGKTVGSGESDSLVLETGNGGVICQRSASGTVTDRLAETAVSVTAQFGTGGTECYLTVGFHYERS